MVRVSETNRGVVRFSNCAFWGPCNQIAEIGGHGTVGFSDCTFVQWDKPNENRAALQASGGSLLVGAIGMVFFVQSFILAGRH